VPLLLLVINKYICKKLSYGGLHTVNHNKNVLALYRNFCELFLKIRQMALDNQLTV
jgi:hypothetical protein